MLNNIRKHFIRKGLVLVICDNIIETQSEFKNFNKSLIHHKKLGFITKQYLTVNINGYNIKFMSKLSESYKVYGMRPEIIYWNITSIDTEEQHILNKYLDNAIYYSSRLNPMRCDFSYDNCTDILSDDFKVKEYINVKSLGYKITRNNYIKNKIKNIFNRKR